MRIAYLGQMADVAGENGISKKIRAQTRVWRERGHAVRYFSLTPTTAVWAGLAPLEVDLVARGGFLRRGLRSRELVRRIRAWRPDVIYFRYAYHSAGLPALFRSIPTIAEINSDDLREYPLTLSRTKWIYHRLTRARILQASTAFVAVTRELAARFAGLAKRTTVIANGIDFDAVAPAPPLVADAPLRLVFVGNTGSPWHGLSRLGEIARVLPGVEINVVGCTPEDWRAGAGDLAQPAGVRFHGMLSRTDYAAFLHSATAAIGTLGLYHKGMAEACPLKVREYLAVGLPVIAGYTDTDVTDEADYFLRLPNAAGSLEPYRRQLQDFLATWRTRRVSRGAVAHLDVAVKERLRLEFLQQFVPTSLS